MKLEPGQKAEAYGQAFTTVACSRCGFVYWRPDERRVSLDLTGGLLPEIEGSEGLCGGCFQVAVEESYARQMEDPEWAGRWAAFVDAI